MMTFSMEINVLIDDEFEDKLSVDWLKAVASITLTTQVNSPNVEIELVITGQQKMRQLNRQYRGQDKFTDVLAFPMLDEKEAEFRTAPADPKHLGEVIISYPQALIQAEEQGHPVKNEVAVLIIHGTLHLLGYDHRDDEGERQMEERQASILSLSKGELN
jgi:probable rRNA maturation factor